MDKTVYAGSIVISLFLIVGSVWFPEDASMWLASSSLSMNISRGILIALMAGLLFTNPPRRNEFRLLLGAVSIGFAAWAVNWLFSGTVALIDTFVFLEASIAFALAAIEAEPRIIPSLSAITSAEISSVFGKRVDSRSSMYGLALTQERLGNRIRRALIMGTLISGAWSQGTKPYRELWRGG